MDNSIRGSSLAVTVVRMTASAKTANKIRWRPSIYISVRRALGVSHGELGVEPPRLQESEVYWMFVPASSSTDGHMVPLGWVGEIL